MLSNCALAIVLYQTPIMVDTQVSHEPIIESEPILGENEVMESLLVGLGTGSPLADINGDGIINFFDIAAFINCVNTGAACADLNGDGIVNFFDIQLFVSA
ncbi:MAG: GC-type dockerin domain-anchored protein [Phycisphaerales bacterium]|nr:GC-type dockerin domain-anchored protein [Phycisphaerales bacterium]